MGRKICQDVSDRECLRDRGHRHHGRWSVRVRYLGDECHVSSIDRPFETLAPCSSQRRSIPGQSYKCYFNQAPFYDQGQCVGPNAATQGGITAAMPAGSWLGALISGYLTDILGRRRAIQVGCLLWSVPSCHGESYWRWSNALIVDQVTWLVPKFWVN